VTGPRPRRRTPARRSPCRRRSARRRGGPGATDAGPPRARAGRRGRGSRPWACRRTTAEMQAHAPEPARVRAAVAVAAGIGELRAGHRLQRAPALHRRRVEQDHRVGVTGAVGGEDADQPLDRLGQPASALVEAGLSGEGREQLPKALPGDREEFAVGGDPDHRLGDAEGGDLRVGQAPTGVLLPFGQEIVGGAEHRSEDLLPMPPRPGALPRLAAWNQSSSGGCAAGPRTRTAHRPGRGR
jgi:hypothetical protein